MHSSSTDPIPVTFCPTARTVNGVQASASNSESKLAPSAPRGREPNIARHEVTVLLVEDNPVNQMVAMEFLSLLGLGTRLARNGFEALAMCLQGAPDLVLMDIQMPGMDGLESARRLRRWQFEGRLPPFPIIALTAHALECDHAASLEAGMDAHLTKPIDFVTLRDQLRRWIKLPDFNT